MLSLSKIEASIEASKMMRGRQVAVMNILPTLINGIIENWDSTSVTTERIKVLMK